MPKSYFLQIFYSHIIYKFWFFLKVCCVAKNKRQKIEISYDRTLIADLFTKGYTVAEIHTAINKKYKKKNITLSQQQISYDLKQIIKEWQKEVFDDLSSHKAIQIRKLLYAQREALKAWEKSQGKMTKVVTKEGFPSKYTEEEAIDLNNGTTTTVEFLAGDPRFLNVFIESSKEISKLLALYDLEKEEDDDDENPVTIVELPDNGRNQ
jgi:hypothetical protein